MDAVSRWVRHRRLTVGLAIFFIIWYCLQLSILHLFGEDVAQWWFYFEHQPNLISPGAVIAPVSHDLSTLSHLAGNVLVLFIAGGIAEPHIGKKRILILVIGLGYLSIYFANATVVIHHKWMLAGASGGIFGLWAYAGLWMRGHAAELLSEGITLSQRGVEVFGSVVLLVGTPVLFFHQLAWVAQPHSGHVIGLLFGVLYYIGEHHFSQID